VLGEDSDEVIDDQIAGATLPWSLVEPASRQPSHDGRRRAGQSFAHSLLSVTRVDAASAAPTKESRRADLPQSAQAQVRLGA
jgi:hypothetical protein